MSILHDYRVCVSENLNYLLSLTLALVPVSRELGLKSTTMVGYSFSTNMAVLGFWRDDANNIWKKKIYIYCSVYM